MCLEYLQNLVSIVGDFQWDFLSVHFENLPVQKHIGSGLLVV